MRSGARWLSPSDRWPAFASIASLSLLCGGTVAFSLATGDRHTPWLEIPLGEALAIGAGTAMAIVVLGGMGLVLAREWRVQLLDSDRLRLVRDSAEIEAPLEDFDVLSIEPTLDARATPVKVRAPDGTEVTFRLAPSDTAENAALIDRLYERWLAANVN